MYGRINLKHNNHVNKVVNAKTRPKRARKLRVREDFRKLRRNNQPIFEYESFDSEDSENITESSFEELSSDDGGFSEPANEDTNRKK